MIKKNSQNGLIFRDKGRKYRPVNVYKKDKKIAGWKEVIPTGESISQVDTYNDSAYLRIYGKSEQVQTAQGKNLLDKHYFKNNAALGAGVVLAETGTGIRLTTIVEGVYKAATISYQLNPSTTYTVSRAPINIISGCTNPNAASIDISNTSGGWIGGILKGATASTFTTNSTGKITVRLYVTSSLVESGDVEFPSLQLELGSTATAYEPFVPDSPSPDYPITINSVSNFDLISSGKNLFDKVKYTSNNNYINVKLLTVGSTYTISCNLNTIFKFSPSYYGTPTQASGITTSWTFVLSQESFDIGRLYCISTTTYDAYSTSVMQTLPLQLELGSTATEYEPFRGLTTINFPYTLRSLPDGTKDYIEIDNVNKTAKLVRNIGERVFTGSEAIGHLIDFTNTVRFEMSILTGGLHGSTNKISTHFPTIGTSADETEHIRGTANVGVGHLIIFWINKTRLTGYSSELTDTEKRNLFKSWLTSQYIAGTPVTVQYQLATPIVEDLDYNEVLTYYPYTQIYTNATIQPTLEGKIRIIDK